MQGARSAVLVAALATTVGCFDDPELLETSGTSSATEATTSTGPTTTSGATTASTTEPSTATTNDPSTTADVTSGPNPTSGSGSTGDEDRWCASLDPVPTACADFDGAAIGFNPVTPPTFVEVGLSGDTAVSPNSVLFTLQKTDPTGPGEVLDGRYRWGTDPGDATTLQFEVEVYLDESCEWTSVSPLRTFEFSALFTDTTSMSAAVQLGPDLAQGWSYTGGGATNLFDAPELGLGVNEWVLVTMMVFLDSGTASVQVGDLLTETGLELWSGRTVQEVGFNFGPWLSNDAVVDPACNYRMDNAALWLE